MGNKKNLGQNKIEQIYNVYLTAA